jgi:hypothetical protein
MFFFREKEEMFAATVATEFISVASHLFTRKTHKDNCLICGTLQLHEDKHGKQQPKSGLKLVPEIFSSDLVLINTHSDLYRTAVILTKKNSEHEKTCTPRHVTELFLLLKTSGFDIVSDTIETAPKSKILFMFADLRNCLRTSIVQALVKFSDQSTNVTVVELVDDFQATLFDDCPAGTTVITCTTVQALRFFIAFSQSRKSRFTAFELLSACHARYDIIITSNTNKRITSVLF